MGLVDARPRSTDSNQACRFMQENTSSTRASLQPCSRSVCPELRLQSIFKRHAVKSSWALRAGRFMSYMTTKVSSTSWSAHARGVCDRLHIPFPMVSVITAPIWELASGSSRSFTADLPTSQPFQANQIGPDITATVLTPSTRPLCPLCRACRTHSLRFSTKLCFILLDSFHYSAVEQTLQW